VHSRRPGLKAVKIIVDEVAMKGAYRESFEVEFRDPSYLHTKNSAKIENSEVRQWSATTSFLEKRNPKA
jgi:hypothetical protein